MAGYVSYLSVIFVIICASIFVSAVCGLIVAFSKAPCRFCKEQVTKGATVCPHCQKDMPHA